MPKYDNTTILIEGQFIPDIDLNELLQTYTPLCDVVLSIYDTDYDKIKKICDQYNNVHIIHNNIQKYRQIPLRIDTQFKNHTAISLLSGFIQICSIRKALKHINTKYIVKTKIDHFYGGMDKFITLGQTDKITLSSLFQRGCKDNNIPNRSRFCLTDTLFMGLTATLRNCFDLCYDNKLLTRVATGIWSPYFMDVLKDIDIADDNDYAREMEKLVTIHNVNEFGPYKLKYFNNVRNYMHDNTKSTYDYLLYGCDC